MRALLSQSTLFRLFAGLAVGSILATLIAAFDCVSVLEAASERPNVLRLWVSDTGLVVPLGLGLGFTGAALGILLHAPNSPSWAGLLRWLRPVEPRRQARLAAITLAAPIACVLSLVCIASISVQILSVHGPSNALGTILAAAVIGVALFWIGALLAFARAFGLMFRARPPDPAMNGVIGLGIAFVTFATLVAVGTTSGAGGALRIFGVFRRQELDLRAPLYALLIMVPSYLGESLARRLSSKALVAIAIIPLALTAYAGKAGMNSRAVAIGIERSAPLGRIMLGPLRRISDRDHDGFSALFGGGDCDDRNASINPSVDDVPGNGIDEDCSGSDATLAPLVDAKTPELGMDYQQAIPKGLNVVLLTIDTVRADVLGSESHVAPNLDKLGEKGAVFVNAYAPASYTGKSVGPFIIGKNSSETQRDWSHFNAFRNEIFIQQRLQKAGIRTVSVQGYWYFYQPPYGFERGFDVIDSLASPGHGYVEGDRTTNADKQADRVIEQLSNPENTSKQFYLWAHFTDPHAEYVTHAGFDFGSDQKGKYLGEVGFVDAQIGRILDAIAASPWASRTVIIVSSDHGEAFGEHGMYRHGFELWEPLVRVPLIIFVPENKPSRIEARRSLIDLVPTVLDVMGVPAPEGQGSDFLSGHSLAPDLFGGSGTPEARPVLVDMSAGPNNAERQAYISGNLKLITSNGRPLGLYDLAADPAEKHDLMDVTDLKDSALAEYKSYRRRLRVVRVSEH